MAAAGRRDLSDWGLLVLRVLPGALLFYGHGFPKLVNYAERQHRFSDPIGLGPEVGFALVVFSEVVASTLVALGLFTRLATVPLIGFFLVAAFVQHANDPFARRELPLLFLSVYATLLFTGPGRWSLDAWIRRKR